jgi:hypothetical protein
MRGGSTLHAKKHLPTPELVSQCQATAKVLALLKVKTLLLALMPNAGTNFSVRRIEMGNYERKDPREISRVNPMLYFVIQGKYVRVDF